MQGISYTMANPNSIPIPGRAEIYYDKPEESKLRFSFSQNMGIASLKSTDHVRVVISFPSHLLNDARREMLASDEWTLIKMELPSHRNGNRYIFTLDPSRTMPWGDKKLQIDFQQLTAWKAGNGDVQVKMIINHTTIQVKKASQKLIVMAYPDQPKDLTNDILIPSILFNDRQEDMGYHPHLFISNPELAPPIANQLSLNLKYENKEKPLAEENWHHDKRPFFKISFSYGHDPDDLTDDEQQTIGTQPNPNYNPLTTAYNIRAEVIESDLWYMDPSDNTTGWTFHPSGLNHQLFSPENNNLDISFTHIVSRLPEGNATLYIQWGNIPGYNGGWKAIAIPKRHVPPKILSFSTPGGGKTSSIPFGSGISLDWLTFGMSEVRLKCVENPRLDKTIKVVSRYHDVLHRPEAALLNCGGIRPKPPHRLRESCAHLEHYPVKPVDPINNFYLQGYSNNKLVGEEVGPVTIRLTNYPPPILDIDLHAEGAIFHVTVNNEPVYYFNTYGASVKLSWLLEDPEEVREVILQDPTGNHIQTLAPKKQGAATITLQKEGKHTIRFIGKDQQELSQGIILKTISQRLVGTSYVSKASYQGLLPLRAPASVISYEDKNNNYKPKKTLIYTYPNGSLSASTQMQLSFYSAGTGKLAFSAPNYRLAYPNVTSPQLLKIIKQPQLNLAALQAPPIPVQDFTWSVSAKGSIMIQLNDGSGWELAKSPGANPRHLLFQSTTAQLPPSLKNKAITLSNINASQGAGELAPFPVEINPTPLSSAQVNLKAEGMTLIFKKQ